MDVLTKSQRSYNMSRIKSKNTKPEQILRKILSQSKIKGYRSHYNLTGKPDIVFPGKRIAIFIDGCFWHKCPKCFKKPATRTRFWMMKISGNVTRDKLVNRELKKAGWKVIRIWEHQVKTKPFSSALRLIKNINNT